MKLVQFDPYVELDVPAAFRRLCVETIERVINIDGMVPAAFRRLCVETYNRAKQAKNG